MSSAATQEPATRPAPKSPKTAPTKRTWLAVALVCLLLGASGAVRYWRDFQFSLLENQSKEAPFPLKNLPMIVGSWRALEGVETTLDPEIAKIAGSSDHILRTYVNDETGDRASVLVLYGLASLVWGHTPQVCYPAVGFRPLMDYRDVDIPLEGGGKAPFREALYGKTEAGATSRHEVYHSFRNAGEWRADMADQWKRFRSNPGMFKIQVERRAKSAEIDDGACRDLLAGLVEAIEKQVSAPAASVVSTSPARDPRD